MNWTFGRKLAFGFAIAILTILVIGISGHRATSDLIDNDRWVTHSQEVKRTLAQLLSSLKDAETGQRGFLLTGDEHFLEPYRAALGDIAKSQARARELTSDNDEQQRRLSALAPVVASRLVHLADVIEARRQRGLEAVVKSNLLLEGKRQMDAVRTIVADLDEAESALLTKRRKQSEQSAGAAQATILWGSALGTLLVLVAGIVISRSLSSQVGVAVRHIQASSAELQAAANQQATGAKEQATAMNEVTTTISELLATSR